MPRLRNHHVVAMIFVAAAIAGCQRPPEPPAAGEQGPPKVVHVDPKSPEGKALAAVRLLPHEQFSNPPADSLAPVPKLEPVTPLTPAVPPVATPTTPAPAAQAPITPAPAGGPQGATPPKGEPAAPPAVPGRPPISEAAPAAGSQLATTSSEASRKAHQFGSGFYATPLGALLFVKDKAKLIGVESALQMYVVEHGKPRDTAEFIDKVVKANSLTLPPLPEGQKYFYNRDEGPNGTLMIEVPKK